jgi:hypothetical protein
MTVLLIFGAVAHQCDIAMTPQRLKQPQGELLSVILDSLVGAIEPRAAIEEFPAVTPAKFSPSNPVESEKLQQPFARTEIRHPRVIPRLLEAPPTNPSGQDPQSIFLSIDWGVNRLGTDHGVGGSARDSPPMSAAAWNPTIKNNVADRSER